MVDVSYNFVYCNIVDQSVYGGGLHFNEIIRSIGNLVGDIVRI